MSHQVFQALEQEPFSKQWYVWCHPETLHELREECQSMRTEDDPIPPTLSERFGREFKADHLLPKGEYFVWPEDVTDFDELTALEHPPGEFVEQTLQYHDIKSYNRHGSFTSMMRVLLPFRLEYVEYRFKHDKIDMDIPELRRLIDKRVPEDHPPVDPSVVEWETGENLEVEAGVQIDGESYWVWRETGDIHRRVPFTYAVSDRELTEYGEDFFREQAMRAFVEEAVEEIGTERTEDIVSRRHSVSDVEFSKQLSDDAPDYEYEIEEVNVGHKVMKTDALVMNSRLE